MQLFFYKLYHCAFCLIQSKTKLAPRIKELKAVRERFTALETVMLLTRIYVSLIVCRVCLSVDILLLIFSGCTDYTCSMYCLLIRILCLTRAVRPQTYTESKKLHEATVAGLETERLKLEQVLLDRPADVGHREGQME